MKKRWNCPECGSGKLLSSRPRKNATDRFCLACSKKNGVLVERVCPTLEKQRTVKAEKAKEAARKKRAKAKAEYVVHGVDLMAELKRVYKAARFLEPELRSRLPQLTIHRSKTNKGTSGRAWGFRHRIHLTCGRDVEDILYVLVHEVAHLVMRARDYSAPSHGDAFKAAEAELLAETKVTRPSYRRIR